MKPSGSSVILGVMYLSWIGYVAAYVWCKAEFGVAIPDAITYGCAGLFISETGALLAIRLKKEGFTVPSRTISGFMGRLGLSTKSELQGFADEYQPKEAKHGKTI